MAGPGDDWPKVDPRLLDYATPKQAAKLRAYIEHGSQEKAAQSLGLSQNAIYEALKGVRKKAADAGYAPGHFESGVAPGYRMGKVTVQRNAGGDVERTWERQSPDALAAEEARQAALEAMTADMPRLDPLEPPAATLAHLATLYTITDYHLGMMAWRMEGGADWDLKIAERTLIGAVEQLVTGAPRSRVGIVNIGGDFLHSDGLVPITPLHGHVLDQDGRFSKTVATAIRCIRRLVDIALMRHDIVELLIMEGNHDLASSLWLRHMFAALYENEPRINVNASELPYYVYQHGRTMLGFHHGHLKKNDQLPLLFAAQFPKVWGETTKRYVHCGHRHHVEEREHSGVTVVQHPTLAARDAYAARGGWIADRAASAITYHSEYGQVGRNTVTPEMLSHAAA